MGRGGVREERRGGGAHNVNLLSTKHYYPEGAYNQGKPCLYDCLISTEIEWIEIFLFLYFFFFFFFVSEKSPMFLTWRR